MLSSMRGFAPQPLVAVLISGLAVAALLGAWILAGSGALEARDVALTLLLVSAVIAAYLFPIHLRKSQKAEMTTVSLYLLAVLSPSAPLAATAAGLAILTAELMVRARRGNLYSDVATSAARYVVVILAGTTVNLVLHDGSTLRLLAVAATMMAVDMLTLPLLVAPVTEERPFEALVSSTKDSALLEGAQYLLGLLGALAAMVQIWGLALLVLPTMLVYVAFKNVKEMQTGTRQMLESMADTVDLRDPYTGGHSRRVAELAAAILKELKVIGPEVELIVSAARVHDIGKIGIPDDILLKPGKLTAEEEAVMQTHPERGADLLRRYPDFTRGVEIVMHHHEAWDGSGYPRRLQGADIPFGSRVIAVADSFDAMTSDRPYRKAMPAGQAAQILREGRGKQWDAQVVDAFLRAMGGRLERPAQPLLHLVRRNDPDRPADSAEVSA